MFSQLSVTTPYQLKVLEKYQLDEFILLTEGVRKGDLKTFNKALVDNQHRFIRCVAS